VKILMSAYACEPGRGSEGGVGWNWLLAASRDHDVWVLTRANNRDAIEAGLAEAATFLPRTPTFVYVDLPDWARFWKRGGFGIRAYYYVWQLLVWRTVRRLSRTTAFDVVHHTTLANLWLPALADIPRVPFILGPVSGGQRVPLRLYPALGSRAALLEVGLRLARFASRINPLVRTSWRRASLIVVNNRETLAVLPARHRRKVVFRSNAVVEEDADVPRQDPALRAPGKLAVCAGRLSPFKGVSLAIRALRDSPRWRLQVVGDGPELTRLRRLAERLGVADRVEFRPALPQAQLWALLASCDALVLPSLKEGASFVAAEAQALGLPVVALDQGGPATLAAFPRTAFRLVRPSSIAETARGIAAALEALADEPPQGPSDAFSRSALAKDLERIYALARAPVSDWPGLLEGETAVALPEGTAAQ
jgi:glycosyltransferase involved in cell wall biosynthesis